MSKAIKAFAALGQVMARRDVSTVAFNPRSTYRKKPATRQEMMKLVYDYCRETGVDDLGAEKAEISSVSLSSFPMNRSELT